MRWGSSDCLRATVPAELHYLQVLFIPDVMSAARAARARGGRPGALPTAEQEESVFLLNSYLTSKQATFISN